MQVKCNIITSAISSLAKEIGKSDAYTCNLVSAWQTEMYRGNIIPTKSQMLDYIKKNQAKVEELKLAIPCYNYEQENGQSKLVRHNGNEITLVHFDDADKLFNKLFNDFKNDSYINGIRESVKTPREAYMFLLWREQSIIQNGYYDDYRDSAKATNDALAKLRLWKQSQTSGQKENKELPTKNDAIDRQIVYTPIGKTQQTYTIRHSEDGQYHIINKEGKEVFKEDSKDRRKIFANLAVQEKRAVVVTYRDKKYVVNNKGQIISVTTGNLMNWDSNNGDRKAIIEEANKKFINSQLIDQLKASGITVLGRPSMAKYLAEKGKPVPTYALQAAKENQKELDDIKAKAIKNGTFMKAPNGKPTNLTEQQWLQVRTKAFKDWFGDWENDPKNASKVVDENGEPLVVYHHTDNPNLTKFSTDFENYFAKDGGTKEAIFFDEEKTGTLNRKYDLPVFLNIRELNEYNETKQQLHDRGTTYREIVNNSAKKNNKTGGVHMKDFDDNKKEHQSIWIIHNPNQVKSATDNNGMFSTENDDIRMAIESSSDYGLKQAQEDYNNAVKELVDTEKELQSKIYEDTQSTSDGDIKINQTESDKGSNIIGIFSGRNVFDAVNSSIEANINKNLIGGSLVFPAVNALNEESNFTRLDNPIKANYAGILKTVLSYFIKNGKDRPKSDWQLYIAGDTDYSSKINTLSKILGVDVYPYFQFESREVNAKGLSGPVKEIYERVTVDAKGLLNVLPTLQSTKQFSKIEKALEFSNSDKSNYQLKLKALHDKYRALDSKRQEKWNKLQEIKDKIRRKEVEESDLPFFKTPNGEVYGFVDKEGNIYLDENIISPEHPIHEYTHLWDRALQKTNSKLWNRGVELMKQTSLWKTIEEDANYGVKWKNENLSQEELDNRIASEVHARFVGEGGAKLLEKLAKEKGQEGIIAKLKNWILEAWKSLKATFSNWSEDEINKLTLKDFNHMTVRDFAEGINPNTINQFNQQNQQSMNNVKTYNGNWTRQAVANDPSTLYIFTDNTDRNSGSGVIPADSWYSKKYGAGHHFPTMTAAVIRGLDNARPISTQRWYHQGAKGPTGRWNDTDFDEFKKVIDDEFEEILKEWNTGKYKTIMFPQRNGLFNTRISNISETRTPKLYQYLYSKYQNLINTVNGNASSNNLSAETDSSDNTMPEIGTGAEQLLKVDTNTPMAKLAMDINPIQRRARVDMLAHQFSEKLDAIVQDKVDELKAELNQEMLGERRPNVLHRIKVQAQLYDNAFEGRKAIMSTAGTSAKEIFDMIKKDLEDAVADTDSYTPEEIKAYQKVIDNFDLLVNETCAKLESTERVRITFSQNNYHNGKSVSKVVSSNIEDTAQKEEDDEEALNDDDTGKRVEGNAGWSYHARFVDPRTSISKTTKHIIANIPMLDENGEYMVDDLGYQRYMDENYAHNVLLNELSTLITPEDFVTTDKDRNPIAFPALEKATEKYPWIQQVIDVLYEHNDYISAFYADFRKDYIPYWMQYYGKDSMGNWQWYNKQMNAPMALESTLNEIRSDYEHGYRLDQYSVYSVGNKLEVDNANIGLDLLNSNKDKDRGALTVLNDPNFDATDAEDEEIDMVINKPTQVFRMLGVNVNKNIITALLGTKDSTEQLKTALNAAKRIFEGIVGGKVAEGADLITAFDEDYKTIAKIVGSVSEIANVGSFRNDDKTYYSYSAPNYMDTMFKKFKSDTRRQDYIDKEFKKYDWFYDKDKEEWYSEWMHILEGNPDDEEFDEECQNIRFNMQMKELKTIKDKTNDPNNRHADYSNWQPMQIKQHFVQEYFSAGYNKSSKTQYGWYNFPISSDSPVAKFIKFKRYVASKENGSVEDQLLPLFRKVVKQELGRMKLVNQRREKGAKPISNFDDDKYMRGAKFCFFPDFEFYYVKEDGTIYDGFGKTKDEIDPSYVSLKDKLSELYEAKDTSAANALIDAAVKYDMDDLYTKFLQDFGTVSITEDKGIRLDNDELTKLGKDTLEDLKKSGAISDSINFSDALHEYFWNQAYATTQIIELTTTDLAFYKDAGEFQKRFKEIYAAGTKLNTLSKYGKKFYKTIYLVDNIITSPSYNDIKKSLDDAVQAHHITKLDEESILKQLEEINVADAQAYRSLSSIRSVLDMMGQWTPEMETTYNNIRKGDWNMNDLNTIWQTLKPFVYTQIDSSDGIGGRMKVPHQNKNSEFALLYAYVAVATGSSRDGHIKTKTSGKLKAMADFMEEKGIDVIQFQSAVKAGNQGDINLNMSHKKLKEWAEKEHITGKFDINDLEKKFRVEQTDRLKNGEISQSKFDDIIDGMQLDYDETYGILEKNAFPNGQEDEEVVHTIPYDDYIIQQPTPEHLLDARAVFGSQFRNLVISDLPDDFKLKIHGKELGKKEILDLYNSLIVENLLDDFDELKERFKNIEKFQEALLQEVNGNPKYGRDMLDALQLVDVKDENGNTHKEFNIPLYNPATTLKIQELVNSMFKNAITKQHVKGGACILVSSFGFTDELHVLHNPDGSIKGMECYMPAYSKDFFQPFMKVDENGNPYLDPTELPNELRRVIGYRIPTEDKYSMAPLYIKGFLPQENGSEIMLPAETTLFSGEDYDVDKKFLMLPEYKVQPYDMRKAYKEYSETHNIINKIGNLFKGTDFDTITDEDQTFKDWFNNLSNEEKEGYKLDKPIITKIKYDLDKKPQEQSRAARNNMIFDLAYSILTSKDTAEKIHNPGSFDKAKREAKMAKIAGNKQLLTLWSKENHTTDNVEATVKSLLGASMKDMKDFLDKYDKERTQMTVDTFIYNHKQNMTGAALIGMYANNTSMQAKFQQTNIGIKDEYTFGINGRRVKSLHDITSPLNERISKNCANFSAASVDNVKDPVLADLRQNTNTANIMGMLLRAGLSIQEASLMFQQPIVAQWIDETDGAKINDLENLIESYSQQLVDNGGEVIDKEKVIREHDFTTEELLTNVVKGLDANDTTNLADNIKSAYLFLNAAHIADDLAELTRISRADSPNGAIKPSIAGFFGQLMRVANYHKKADTDGFTLEGIGDCVKNNKLNGLYNDRDEMRKALLEESSMPVLQAFYSLGIESARHYLSPYFTQLTNYMSQVTRRVGNNSGFDNVPDQVLNTLYKDFIYYALTHSKIFGNGIEVNGKSTYEDKRKFYLYEYPKHLMTTIANNPDIAQLTAIKKLEVKDGVIVMTNSGRLTQPARESLQRDFEMLLYMDNKVAQQMAIDLFMYSFYQEGFNFGPNTIGGMFSTLFLDSIPEYVQALRNIPKEMPNSEDVSTYFDDFLNQFYANRYNMSGVLPIRTVSSSDFTQSDDKNKITVPINKVKNWKTQSAYSYVGLKDEDGTFLGYYSVPITSGKSVTYTKLSTINDSNIDGKVFNVTKYDANSTTAEIAESLKEEIVLRDKAGMLKTDDDIYGGIDSLLENAEISPDNTDDTAKAAMNDEVQNQAPADIKQKAIEDADIPSDIFDEIGSLTSDDIYTMEGGQNTLDTKMC